MPVASYPVNGVVYDVDGSTVMANVIVTAYNSTKDEWLPANATSVTNSSGEYTIDLANFPTDYSNGDKIQILAYTSDDTKSINARHTIDTVTGSHSKNLYLHWGEPFTSTVKVTSITVTYSTTGGKYVDFYDRENDAIRIRIEAPASDTRTVHFGGKGGLEFKGGICPILEDDTDTNIFITITTDISR